MAVHIPVSGKGRGDYLHNIGGGIIGLSLQNCFPAEKQAGEHDGNRMYIPDCTAGNSVCGNELWMRTANQCFYAVFIFWRY